jgi:hypothetical protein
MDVIEGGITSLRKASKHWNVPLTSLSNHLYGKITFRELGPKGVLIEEEDQGVLFGFWQCRKLDCQLVYNN